MTVKARVKVSLKEGVADPEGSNVKKTLGLLGISGIKNVHFSKVFEFELELNDKKEAESVLKKACEKLLSNPVINDYKIEIDE